MYLQNLKLGMRANYLKTYKLQKRCMKLVSWLFVVQAEITSSTIFLVLFPSIPQSTITYSAIGT